MNEEKKIIVRKTSRFAWFSFGCLASIVLVVGFFILMISAFSSSIKKSNPTATSVKSNSWLHLNISGMLPEHSAIKDNFFDFGEGKTSIHELIQKINAAKTDQNILGILLEPKFVACGLASSHELMLAIDDFKTSGKKVIAYFDMGFNRDYLLASVADEIYLNPSASGGILLTGIGSNTMFYKDLMDKFGVKMRVIHAGKYKGAGENYSRTNLSKPVRKNLNLLFDDVYNNLLGEIAKRRNIDMAKIKQIYEDRDEMFVDSDTAVEMGLVDVLSYRDNMLKSLGVNKKRLVKIGLYNKTANVTKVVTKNKIAVIYAQGTIMPQSGNFLKQNLSSARLNKVLDDVIKDDNIKGVVLRVNSPGGSALESDIMHAKLLELKAKKPLVVSMGDVAASGGYFISAPADYILADKFTITGSIGVVAMLPDVSKAAKNLGITSDGVTRGKFTSINDPISNRDVVASAIKKSIGKTYIEFKTRVSKGRNLTLEQVEEIAQGQVWSSKTAKKIKLIDEVGTLADAIKKVSQIAGIEDYNPSYYPKQSSIFELFLAENFDIDLKDVVFNEAEKEGLPVNTIYNEYKAIKKAPIQMRLPFVIE